MPATPVYALPYPAATDPADVPADIQRLADRLEIVIPPLAAGAEISYTQIVAGITVTATSEAGAQAIITAPAASFNGSDRIIAEFFTPQMGTGAITGSLIIAHLFDGGTSLGNLALLQTPAAAVTAVPVFARRILTPSAGSHTFSIRARVVSSDGSIQAGGGVAGSYSPAYLRLTKA